MQTPRLKLWKFNSAILSNGTWRYFYLNNLNGLKRISHTRIYNIGTYLPVSNDRI